MSSRLPPTYGPLYTTSYAPPQLLPWQSMLRWASILAWAVALAMLVVTL